MGSIGAGNFAARRGWERRGAPVRRTLKLVREFELVAGGEARIEFP